MIVNPYTNQLLLNQYISGAYHQTTVDAKSNGFIPNMNFLKPSVQYFTNLAGNQNQSFKQHQGNKKVKTDDPNISNQSNSNPILMRDIFAPKFSSHPGMAQNNPSIGPNNFPQRIMSFRPEFPNLEMLNQNRISDYFTQIQKNDKLINELTRLIKIKETQKRTQETVKIDASIIPKEENTTDQSPSVKSASDLDKTIPNQTGVKRKSVYMDENNLKGEESEIKIQKPIKLKRFCKKRSYVQKRRELKEIEELENQLDLLMKKNKKEVDIEEENFKDTKRRLNGLQKIKKINEKIEKIQDIDVRDEVVCNFMRVDNSREIRIGSEYQALIPQMNKETKKSKPVRIVWSPDWLNLADYEDYLKDLVELLGCKEIAEDKTLKLLMRSNMDKETALVSVRKNKTYYKNMLCPASRKYINELKKLS